MSGFLKALRHYREARIKRPIDWLKQPLQDVLRRLNAALARRLGRAGGAAPARPVVRRILLIRRNRLGDAICLLPWVAAAKAQHGVTIDVLGSRANVDILRRSGLFGQVDELPETFLGSKWLIRWHPVMRALLRRPRYDLVFNASATYSSFACFAMWQIPAGARLGVRSNRGSVWEGALTHGPAQGEVPADIHQVEKINFLARHVGLECAQLPVIRLADPQRARRSKVLLCPMVNREESRWPDGNWLAVGQALAQAGWEVQWIGISHDPLRPALRTSLEQFIEALSVARLVICSEGGASHLACLFGADTVVLSGKQIRQTWAPWSDQYVLFEEENAVARIRPDQVLAAAHERLGRMAQTA